MVNNANFLISYLTNPHIDQAERAEEAAGLMLEIFNGMKPEVAFIRLPLVAPSVSSLTASGPYADMINCGQLNKTNVIANVSVLAGFVYSDIRVNGISIIVTARNEVREAQKLCRKLAELGWMSFLDLIMFMKLMQMD